MRPRPTKAIALDSASRADLATQLAARAAGEDVPVRWHEFLDRTSRAASGLGACEATLRHVISGRASLFAWQPTREALAAAFSPGGLVYLCWGLPKRGGWRDRVLHTILTRARHVLVNDRVTREEIRAAIGREPDVVPFYVDPDYFAFRPLEGRGEFLFCNGANDRDPELLVALAEIGHRIVWLVNDAALYARYERRHPDLTLRSKIPFTELRVLYQTCKLNIMPATRDVHCAGQTTGMEAIACGASLVVSPGRTASIFEALPSVSIVADNSPGGWDKAIRDMSDRYPEHLQSATRDGRNALVERISPLVKHFVQLLQPPISATQDGAA